MESACYRKAAVNRAGCRSVCGDFVDTDNGRCGGGFLSPRHPIRNGHGFLRALCLESNLAAKFGGVLPIPIILARIGSLYRISCVCLRNRGGFGLAKAVALSVSYTHLTLPTIY